MSMKQFIGVLTIAGQVDAPATGPTAALIDPAAAGNVDDGAHEYKVTFVTGVGETEASPSGGVVTVVDKTTNGKVSLTDIPISSSPLVTSRKIYRTEAGLADFKLLTTIANNTATTFTDNVADGSLTTAAPSTNDTTAAGSLADLLVAAGYDGVQALSTVKLLGTGSGTAVVSTDPDIVAEADGYPIPEAEPGLELPSTSKISDSWQAGGLYLFSATVDKTVVVVAKSVF